ncbi:hypothetical protein CLU79DRAFT_718757 [Phycomyces nitens]|nr:hypothetical protein CLU79DRAFT_718757 [Phycomyces nitens]
MLLILKLLEVPTKTYEAEIWVDYLNTHIPILHKQALENIKKAQARQKHFYDKGKAIEKKYQPGDLVAYRNLEKLHFPKERWSGPWTIIKANNKNKIPMSSKDE